MLIGLTFISTHTGFVAVAMISMIDIEITVITIVSPMCDTSLFNGILKEIDIIVTDDSGKQLFYLFALWRWSGGTANHIEKNYVPMPNNAGFGSPAMAYCCPTASSLSNRIPLHATKTTLCIPCSGRSGA